MNFVHVDMEEFFNAITFMESKEESIKTKKTIFKDYKEYFIGWDSKYRKSKNVPCYLNIGKDFKIGFVKRNLLIPGKYVFKLNKVIQEWMKQNEM